MATVADLLVRIDATTVQLRSELARADKSLADFGRTADRKVSDIEKSFGRLGTGIQGITRTLGGLGIAIGGMQLAQGFTQLSDAATTVQNRLRSVSGSSAELRTAYDQLFASSQHNSVSMESSVDLYTRLMRAMEGTGATGTEVAEIVDTLGKAAKLSGMSADDSSRAMVQLSQAFNSGVLAGDEFKTMAEAMPTLLTAVATEISNVSGEPFDVVKSKLKEMASEGEISIDVLIDAIRNMRDETVSDFENMETTIGDAKTRMWNALTDLIGKIDEIGGASDAVKSKIDDMSAVFGWASGVIDTYGGSLRGLMEILGQVPTPLETLISLAKVGHQELEKLANYAASVANQVAGATAPVVAGARAGVDAMVKGMGASFDAFPMGSPIPQTTKSVTVPIPGSEERAAAALAATPPKINWDHMISPDIQDAWKRFDEDLRKRALGKDAPAETDAEGNLVIGINKGTVEKPKSAPKPRAQLGPRPLSKDDLRAVEGLRKETMTARDKYQERVAELDDLLQRDRIPEELYKQGLESATAEFQKATAPKAAKKPKGGGGRGRSEGDKEQERAESEGRSISKSVRTDAEAYGNEIQRLDELLARNAITHEDHARAVAEADAAMQKNRMAFQGGQEAATAYLAEVARLDAQLSAGAISQDEHSARVLHAQQKYGDAKSGAASYAAEVARLDNAFRDGAISQEEHTAGLAVAQSAMNEGLADAARLWEETRTPLERYNEELRKLSELWAAGLIGDDTRMRAAAQLMEELKSATEETNASMKAAKALGDDLGMSFASAFEDAIIEGGKLRDIMKGLWEDIQRIVVRQMVTVPLATGLSAMLTGVTGAMMGGGGAGAATGAQMGAVRGAFAEGGFVKGEGSGTSDSIPAIMPGGGIAMLSNGEFIVNARSAARHENLLQAINSGRLSKGFASGGPIGNIHSPTAAAAGNIQIILENKSQHPLKMEDKGQQSQGPDGRTMIKVMVTDAVKEAMAGGEFDRTMGARYGAAVQTIRR